VIAVDTCVLVRLALRDDENQYRVALEIAENETVYIMRQVLLELVWVLGSNKGYKKSRQQIAQFLRELIDSDNAIIEDLTAVKIAIDWFEKGAGFADALHTAIAQNKNLTIKTFDQSFCKQVNTSNIVIL
jgi:predicted nucleic-acid-binding protein